MARSSAAAHSLSCGHMACGMCLYKWLVRTENSLSSISFEAPTLGFGPSRMFRLSRTSKWNLRSQLLRRSIGGTIL